MKRIDFNQSNDIGYSGTIIFYLRILSSRGLAIKNIDRLKLIESLFDY